MRAIWFSNVEAFSARVAPYLLPREAEHNLTLGLLANIRHDSTRFPEAVFALVEAASGAVQLVAIKTNPERNLILSLAQFPAAVVSLADELHARALPLVGVTAPNDESIAFTEAWTARTGQVAHLDTPMRTFKLDAVNPVTGVPGHMRRPVAADRAQIIEWELAFRAEAFPEMRPNPEDAARTIDYRLTSDIAGIFLWDDGGAVSYVGYGGPTPHGIRIGPVYTPPQYRKRGYASACVAALSQHLLSTGHEFCFLFTDLRNPTSNHIYQQIGYRAVCDFNEYHFLAR